MASAPARTAVSISRSSGSGSSPGAAAEHVGQLEQPDAGVAVRLVVGQGLQQARPQRRAQQALLGGHRVGEGDGVLGQPGPGMVAGPEQRQGHGFGQPEAHHHLAEQPAVALALRERAGMGRGRHRLADALVAVLARHLLDDVDLLDAVGPPAGDGDLLHAGAVGRGHVEADGLQEPGDVAVGQLDAEQLVGTAGAQARSGRLGQDTACVDGARRHLHRRARLAQQLDEAADRGVDHVGVDTALEAGRGLGAQAEARRGPGDPAWLEPRHLQRDRRGAVVDLRRGAAHDPGDADGGVLAVADQAGRRS